MTNKCIINSYEWEFLTDNWEGVKGAAYNEVYEFCQEKGLIDGFNRWKEPLLTSKGQEQIFLYESGVDND
jgi:hypothetical protein